MHFTPTNIEDLPTPCCLIDKAKMQRNIARLSAHIGNLQCTLRPHVKTHKSIEVTKAIIDAGNVKGITVSTLKEADYFFKHGMNDILYAVGITPNKIAHVAQLIQQGCDLTIVIDNEDMLSLVLDKMAEHNCVFKVIIELDTDGHRSGVNPHSHALLSIAKHIKNSAHAKFEGVMTHAGESYACFTEKAKQDMAAQERDLTLHAVKRLFEVGIHCNTVSIGSTPTAFAVDQLDGITEVRAGVYVFFDLVMAGLGVCDIDDIAMSVLGTVIGHQKDKGWVITDAGWMAMSRDRGTADHPQDYGYGLVSPSGSHEARYIMSDANQEHGIITEVSNASPESHSEKHIDSSLNSSAENNDSIFTQFPAAKAIEILPNHACATAAQYDHYYVVENGVVIDKWLSIGGW
ncbi:alanine racemase [Alteromonas sp. MB-3u-76]|uniref:alanine racemase n=1 Tax=Alteromonas sp. MB-3u-76 TaxID=2058133 RepID=UPI000C30657D|nr:alanine racemase [Alteromonas sp. MB-3u-76]AUC86876.1 alanine racemase [Alteromonas sp. MB-3u-76]